MHKSLLQAAHHHSNNGLNLVTRCSCLSKEELPASLDLVWFFTKLQKWVWFGSGCGLIDPGSSYGSSLHWF
jgi:hypothetical protein